jgi:hypothetical protein
MLKQLTICGALLGVLTVPVGAQQREAGLHRMRVSGAAFDIVLAMPKSPPQWMDGLNMSPDALLMHLTGGELIVAFEDAREMLKAAETLRSSMSSSHWVGKDGTPLAVYVVPRAE